MQITEIEIGNHQSKFTVSIDDIIYFSEYQGHLSEGKIRYINVEATGYGNANHIASCEIGIYDLLDQAYTSITDKMVLKRKTMKTITAIVTYTVEVSVGVADDASDQEQRQAIFDKADLELNPYGNGCIIKCSNPDLEE